jgi:hypothetical protein
MSLNLKSTENFVKYPQMRIWTTSLDCHAYDFEITKILVLFPIKAINEEKSVKILEDILYK